MIISKELGFIESEQLEPMLKSITKEAKMINSLITKIKEAKG